MEKTVEDLFYKVSLYKISAFNSKQIILASSYQTKNISLPDFNLDTLANYILSSNDNLLILANDKILIPSAGDSTSHISLKNIIYVDEINGNVNHIYCKDDEITKVYCCLDKQQSICSDIVIPWYVVDNSEIYHISRCPSCSTKYHAMPNNSKIISFNDNYLEISFVKENKEYYQKISIDSFEEYLSPSQLLLDEQQRVKELEQQRNIETYMEQLRLKQRDEELNSEREIMKLNEKLFGLIEEKPCDSHETNETNETHDTRNIRNIRKMDESIITALEMQKILENSMAAINNKKSNKEILLELLTQNLDEVLGGVQEKDKKLFISIALRMAEILTENL